MSNFVSGDPPFYVRCRTTWGRRLKYSLKKGSFEIVEAGPKLTSSKVLRWRLWLLLRYLVQCLRFCLVLSTIRARLSCIQISIMGSMIFALFLAQYGLVLSCIKKFIMWEAIIYALASSVWLTILLPSQRSLIISIIQRLIFRRALTHASLGGSWVVAIPADRVVGFIWEWSCMHFT